jgi:hypothetical protein
VSAKAIGDCSVIATTVAVAPETRANTKTEKTKSFRITTPISFVCLCQAIRVGHVIVITRTSKAAFHPIYSVLGGKEMVTAMVTNFPAPARSTEWRAG